MADNVAITAGSGTTIAADDIGAGVLAQRVKVVWGPDGTGNDTDVASGKPMPVQLRTSTGTELSLATAAGQATLYTEDAAGASDPVGTAVILRRRDTLSTTEVSADADNIGWLGSKVGSAYVTLVAPDGSVNTGAYTNTATFTTGTTGYVPNDAVGASGAAAALTFANMGPSGGIVEIVSASLEIDTTALISGETSYRLYLYNVTPPSAINDSAAWTLPSGDRASFLGYVDLGTPVALAATTLYVQQDNIGKRIKLSGTSIFAYLVTNGTFTPSARVHVITLHTQAV